MLGRTLTFGRAAAFCVGLSAALITGAPVAGAQSGAPATGAQSTHTLPTTPGLLTTTQVPAITVPDLTPAGPGTGYNNPAYQVPPGSALGGVARLLMTNQQGQVISGCSGTLLWTGMDILTAAHCVSSGNGVVSVGGAYATFLNPGGGETTIRAASITPMSSYTGSTGDPHDLAILHLSSPVSSSTPMYNLYNGNPLFQPTIFAGYGLTGNGLTGGVVNTLFSDLTQAGGLPVLRFGFNRWETTYTDTFISDGFSSALLLSDFDDGTLTNNFICNLWGGPSNPNGLSQAEITQLCNSGFGLSEVGISSGDSGGPGFIFSNGEYEVAGVTSTGSARCYRLSDGSVLPYRGSCPTGYTVNLGYFGGFATHISTGWNENAAFIYSVVPEPSSVALLATGLVGLVPALRRRRTTVG